MSWLLLALISCATVCMAIEVTRRSRINGYEILLYRCLISGFLLLPFFHYMHWPTDIGFYVMAGLNAIIYAWGNIVMSNLAVRRNGRVAMMFQPVMIFATYLGWMALDRDQIDLLIGDHEHAAWTAGAFLMLIGSLHFIRRNDYAWSSLIIMVPVGLAFALMNIAQKWFLNTPDSGLGMILVILLIGNFGQVIALPLLAHWRPKGGTFQVSQRAAFPIIPLTAIAVCHMVSWGTLMMAMQVAVNPAYPVAIMALCPVMFQLYYWLRGWRDNASPVAGAALTISAFILGIINA